MRIGDYFPAEKLEAYEAIAKAVVQSFEQISDLKISKSFGEVIGGMDRWRYFNTQG